MGMDYTIKLAINRNLPETEQVVEVWNEFIDLMRRTSCTLRGSKIIAKMIDCTNSDSDDFKKEQRNMPNRCMSFNYADVYEGHTRVRTVEICFGRSWVLTDIIEALDESVP